MIIFILEKCEATPQNMKIGAGNWTLLAQCLNARFALDILIVSVIQIRSISFAKCSVAKHWNWETKLKNALLQNSNVLKYDMRNGALITSL